MRLSDLKPVLKEQGFIVCEDPYGDRAVWRIQPPGIVGTQPGDIEELTDPGIIDLTDAGFV